MQREVAELRQRTKFWYDFCVDETITNSDNKKKSPVVSLVKITNKEKNNDTCSLLTAKELDFTKFLRIRQMKRYPGSMFLSNHLQRYSLIHH